MRKRLLKVLIGLVLLLGVVGLVLFALARKEAPTTITYGMSFSVPYAKELGLDPDDVFDALIDDMGVRNFRLAAHWPLIEPKRGQYDFTWMDRDIEKAEAADAHVIFAVGRRLPRWPECHIPDWAKDMTWDEQKAEIRDYLTTVVNHYKDSSAITYWQVENEPYLNLFANEYCGDLDEDFLKEEIALVHTLDPTRPVLVTDSGNLGTWRGAYENGDAFGTSVYVYFWNPQLGQFKTVLPPWFYRAKEKVMALLYGEKKTFLIELELEPWLLTPVVDAPLETQFSRMDLEKFDEIIDYAKGTRYDTQFLWGGEWWYWLKKQGHPEMWERGKQLFSSST
ncbi:MAG TPA: beta-galactosidase [Candidatus Paceibacterota bacterium]|nr:beta-galactosidase [Candidatus Paceibacterota bacterium]